MLDTQDAAPPDTADTDDHALHHLVRAVSLIHGARQEEAGEQLALALAFVGLDSACKVTISVAVETD